MNATASFARTAAVTSTELGGHTLGYPVILEKVSVPNSIGKLRLIVRFISVYIEKK